MPKAPTAMLSHPPPNRQSPASFDRVTRLPPKKRECSTRLSGGAVTGYSCTTSKPYPIYVCMPKITTIHSLEHGIKRPHLESDFPPSPSWEACDPPPMANRDIVHWSSDMIEGIKIILSFSWNLCYKAKTFTSFLVNKFWSANKLLPAQNFDPCLWYVSNVATYTTFRIHVYIYIYNRMSL